MLKLITAIFFSSFCVSLVAQQTINGVLNHDGIDREYVLYIPEIYDTQEGNAPLVINMHGYTSNSYEQMIYGDFRQIADNKRFLIVHPQGTIGDDGQTFWNAEWGGNVDDIGFISALIDDLATNYKVDENRVYATGMSNGGFMSYTLSCRLSDKIAAMASVTGSMTALQLTDCAPSRAVPVMEIHGNQDPTVPYNGNTWMAAIDDVVAFWVDHNNCDDQAIFNDVPNTNTNDNSTAEHYVYANGDQNSSVELYKIINGAHTWPGTFITLGVTNQDINASEKIWEFFDKYSLQGLISKTIEINDPSKLNISPNPAADHVVIQTDLTIAADCYYSITDNSGKQVAEGKLISNNQNINLTGITSGIYFIQIQNSKTNVSQRFVKL